MAVAGLSLSQHSSAQYCNIALPADVAAGPVVSCTVDLEERLVLVIYSFSLGSRIYNEIIQFMSYTKYLVRSLSYDEQSLSSAACHSSRWPWLAAARSAKTDTFDSPSCKQARHTPGSSLYRMTFLTSAYIVHNTVSTVDANSCRPLMHIDTLLALALQRTLRRH